MIESLGYTYRRLVKEIIEMCNYEAKSNCQSSGHILAEALSGIFTVSNCELPKNFVEN